MTTHPSYGPMPPHIMQDAIAAPFGKAALIIRKYDPLFGLRGSGMKRFRAKVSRKRVREEMAMIEVIADTKEQVEAQIGHMNWHGFHWDEGSSYEEESNIDNIQEVQP